MKKPASYLLMIIALLPVLLINACSNTGSSPEPAVSQEPSASAQNANNMASTYPLQTDQTLSYWLLSPSTLNASIYEVPFYEEWQKRIGVNLKFSEISASQAKESFSTMLASGNLPDIIEYNWLNGLPGGPEKALSEGYILRLNDLIDQHAPNLKKYLQEHPELDKLIKTDNGDYYVFPFLKEGGMTQQWSGPVLRKDWLTELGLQVPQTIEDWHTVLTAFKSHKGSTLPLALGSQTHPLQGFLDGAFIGAFGVIRDFYVEDDGLVRYGPLEPGYKQFLSTIRQWYAEGLIDPNFTQTDRKALDAHMTSSDAGATVASGAAIDRWEQALTATNADAVFTFAPYPVLNKGDKPKFGQFAWPYGAEASAAIAATSTNPVLAVQVLDYAYGEEGYLLFNYGKEGLSYNLNDGKPELTELITHNPDNLSYLEALSIYTHTVNPGPYIESRELIDNLAVTNEDHNYDVWKTDNLQHVLPPMTISEADSSEYARIINDINTLVDEISLKIILGTESLDAYDNLVKQLERLNIKRAIEIQQSAFDRFKQR
ncbi:extracellular solute-binding protein [Paenibacillus agri]|uniref:Extracellular solute-binding protein n=1 Tax=Paenibacillus agri TaxID=2744309 RepID=A0A850EKW9_9BACL|nr:extracellular solute-binding protein [Paenibacillus agri]NUU60127.1 extracellular solute-binding protein [Paenibacillus agri]